MGIRRFHWDVVDDCVMHETDGAGNTLVAYTHEPGQFGPLLSENRGGTESYHHYDALGSTTMLTNDAGTVTDTLQYDAWGNPVVRTGTTPTPYTWVGRWGYQDDITTTGGYYIRARTFQPMVARWASVDQFPFAEAYGLFTYSSNRSISMFDPSGLSPCCGVSEFVVNGPGFPAEIYHIGSRWQWGVKFETFARFLFPPYRCSCCEFRQYVRGGRLQGRERYFDIATNKWKPRTQWWPPFSGFSPLLIEDTDPWTGSVGYGHRSGNNVTYNGIDIDVYQLFDRPNGCQYDAFDIPGLILTRYLGDVLERRGWAKEVAIDEEFTLQIVDTCNGDAIKTSETFNVTGCTLIRPRGQGNNRTWIDISGSAAADPPLCAM